MFVIDEEAPGEAGAREALLDRAMGPGRFAKTSQRLRDGRQPELALVARENGRLVGSLRLWLVSAAGVPVSGGGSLLLLGPLAVEPGRQGEGIGAGMMRRALNRATAEGHSAVLLVGDAPYYARFGFTAAAAQNLEMPGPVERHRFLGLELRSGALKEARGLLCAAGIWQASVPPVVAPPFPAAPQAAMAA